MAHWIVFSLLGLVEGLTEFVPISSSGHLIVAHELLGATGPDALAVDAVLQFGAVLAVIVYFFKDLVSLAYALLCTVTGKPVKPEEQRLLWALIVGTIPAVVLGLLLEKSMETIFRNTHLVAYALITGSLIMLGAEVAPRLLLGVRDFFAKKSLSPQSADLRSPLEESSLAPLSISKGFGIGLFQALALVPGMSRSGMTIAGGLFLGLSREQAARFGFLLSIPIILGSGAKKTLDLVHTGALSGLEIPLLLGTIAAFASGLTVIHWLLKFLRTRPLYVFIAYRVALAAVILAAIPAL